MDEKINKRVQDARVNMRPIYATIIANISALTVGIMLKIGVNHRTVENPITPFYLITLTIATLSTIIFGLFASQLFCERYGRKNALCWSAIPLIVCCLLVAFLHRVSFVMLAFSFGGVGISMCLSVLPIYVSEISSESSRGALCSMRMISITFGFGIGFLVVHYWNIQGAAFIAIFFALIFLILMKRIPESPIFLVRSFQIGEATRSLMWLKGNDEQSMHDELSKIEQAVQMLPIVGRRIGGNEVGIIRDLFRHPVKYRGLIIAAGLFTAQSLWEAITMLKYRMRTWETDCYCISPVLPLDVVSVVAPILGSIAATILIDLVGRRPLLLISCVGMSFQLIIDMLPPDSSISMWLSAALIFASMITYHLGMGTVPSVIAVEVFQQEALVMGYMVCQMISWTILLVSMWIPRFVSDICVSPIIRIVLSICYFLFTYFLVFETKGETRESIVSRLSNGYRSQ